MESCLSLTLKQADTFPPPCQNLVLPQLAIFTTYDYSNCQSVQPTYVLYIHSYRSILHSTYQSVRVYLHSYSINFLLVSVTYDTIQVRAVDDATPPRTGMAQVTVQVTNVNDNPPIITNPAGERLQAQCTLNSKHHPSLTIILLVQIQVLPSVGRKTLCPQPCLL